MRLKGKGHSGKRDKIFYFNNYHYRIKHVLKHQRTLHIV